MLNRLTILIETFCNGNRSEFARSLKLNKAVLAAAQARGSISLDIIQRILTEYPQVSAEWLMRGEGNMRRSTTGEYEQIRTLQEEVEDSKHTIEDLKKDKETLRTMVDMLQNKQGIQYTTPSALAAADTYKPYKNA